ncbi:hypothetical protein L6164_033956 [Bauhinia variegata]|uniref:Uncharacterized protein n=1 Tax=Bauhinia variegata TaxID=167791 RepID=A0ACB9KTF6_BAUVA|nr:hypothetical protein L6164_033956 [Bauhinia variegata]
MYVACMNSQPSNHYELYAISCHYGGLGGGHYIAFVQGGQNTWYEFDDNGVSPHTAENDPLRCSKLHRATKPINHALASRYFLIHQALVPVSFELKDTKVRAYRTDPVQVRS